MQKLRVDIIMSLFCLNENNCKKKKKKKKIVIVKSNIAIRIAGKVSRYIDASINRATATNQQYDIAVSVGGRQVSGRVVSHVGRIDTGASTNQHLHNAHVTVLRRPVEQTESVVVPGSTVSTTQ